MGTTMGGHPRASFSSSGCDFYLLGRFSGCPFQPDGGELSVVFSSGPPAREEVTSNDPVPLPAREGVRLLGTP